MNKENINKAIDLIAASSTFNMGAHFHPCGTPACLSGHIQAHIGVLRGHTITPDVENTVRVPLSHGDLRAMRWLDVTRTQAEDLFYPTGFRGGAIWKNITKEQALTTLKRFRDTGEIVWDA